MGVVFCSSTAASHESFLTEISIPRSFAFSARAVASLYLSSSLPGAIISNVKSDKSNVAVKYQNQKIETGFRKFGAVLGDNAEIGCNAVLNPGTILGRNTSVYPTSMVRGVIEENSIFKNSGEIIKKI